jgi:hypothetical protein
MEALPPEDTDAYATIAGAEVCEEDNGAPSDAG